MIGSRTTLEARARTLAAAVLDPELGDVTIGELGLVRNVHVDDRGCVEVLLTPTFLGCPALSLIAGDVERAVKTLNVADVRVRFVATPGWSPAEISAGGREKLAKLGIGVASPEGNVQCPYCGSDELAPQVPVGSTSCRSVWWCSGCRTVVDVMRGTVDS